MKVYELCGWIGCFGIGLIVGSIADFLGIPIKHNILITIGCCILYFGFIYTTIHGDRNIRWG